MTEKNEVYSVTVSDIIDKWILSRRVLILLC